MEDIKIIKQLMNGHHLNKKELKRAKQLVHGLKMSLKNRTAPEN